MPAGWLIDGIARADSKNLSSLIKPDSVALTVTSPPYRNAIDYGRHVNNLRKNTSEYFRGRLKISLDDYLSDLARVFGEVYKVTVEGGLCCIVIGNELSNGTMLPLPSLLLAKLLKLDDGADDGWQLHEEIIWNKVTGGRNGVANRFSVTVQHPYPLYYHANIMHEHILVLRKGAKKRLRKERSHELPINDVMKKEIANSIWNIAPVPPNSLNHPAPFPEQIPWRLIRLYTYAGETVLDPFNGSGQTTKVAKRLDRHYIGIDIEKEYVKLARRRLDEPLRLSKNLLVPRWQRIEWQEQEVSSRSR